MLRRLHVLHKLARGLEVAAADSAKGTERAFGQLRREEGKELVGQEGHHSPLSTKLHAQLLTETQA